MKGVADDDPAPNNNALRKSINNVSRGCMAMHGRLHPFSCRCRAVELP